MIALKTDVWTTAKLRNADELAKAEKQRNSNRSIEAGRGTVGDLLDRYQREYSANTSRAEKSKRATPAACSEIGRPVLVSVCGRQSQRVSQSNKSGASQTTSILKPFTGLSGTAKTRRATSLQL
jgi:hypothetical protein